MKSEVFIDVKTILKMGIGAFDSERHQFHDARISSFSEFVKKHFYIAGQNIFECDLKYLEQAIS